MPWQGGSGFNGIPWGYCERCGWQYPVDHLVKQRGIVVCVDKCYDNPLIFDRERLIAETIEDAALTEQQPVRAHRFDEQEYEEEL